MGLAGVCVLPRSVWVSPTVPVCFVDQMHEQLLEHSTKLSVDAAKQRAVAPAQQLPAVAAVVAADRADSPSSDSGVQALVHRLRELQLDNARVRVAAWALRRSPPPSGRRAHVRCAHARVHVCAAL